MQTRIVDSQPTTGAKVVPSGKGLASREIKGEAAVKRRNCCQRGMRPGQVREEEMDGTVVSGSPQQTGQINVGAHIPQYVLQMNTVHCLT